MVVIHAALISYFGDAEIFDINIINRDIIVMILCILLNFVCKDSESLPKKLLYGANM